MKKLILSIGLTLSFFSHSVAQDFYHGIGGGLLMITYNQEYTAPGINVSSQGNTQNVGFMYNPMLAFDAGRNSAFCLASYPFLGFSLNSREGGTIGIEVPLVAEYYFGDVDDVAGFIGGGFSFALAGDQDFSGSLLGPQISGGAQFEIQDNLVKLRLAVTPGLIKSEESGLEYTKNNLTAINLSATYPLL